MTNLDSTRRNINRLMFWAGDKRHPWKERVQAASTARALWVEMRQAMEKEKVK